jgi:23S rRNA pseudouridine955/2504/2580 synthase
MSGVQQRVVSADENELRLDKWFKKHFPSLPFGRLQKLLRGGQIRVDGGRVKAETRLLEGQGVRVPPIEIVERTSYMGSTTQVSEQDIKGLRQAILYEDKEVLVLNKPVGLAVQGGTATKKHVDGILQAMAVADGNEYRLTHRLDRDTSGVLVIAKTAKAAQHYTEMFRTNQVQKIYWAVVAGVPPIEEGYIDAPLIKAPGAKGEKMIVDFTKGKKASTYYRVIDEAFRRASWLLLAPKTGRTHQLRVHCTSMDTPILGDGKYGGKAAYVEGADVVKKLHLHARRLETVKQDGNPLIVEAPLSATMKDTFAYFGFDPTERSASQLPEQ